MARPRPTAPAGPKCRAYNNQGVKCGNKAIPGGLVCRSHGGAAPQVANRAAVVAEVLSWGLGTAHADPGEVLLRLVTQSARRVESYSRELEAHVAESEVLRKALIGKSYGEFGEIGEYIRGLVVLEAQERDRCATFASKAVAAGLDKRRVELAERQGALIGELLNAVLNDPALGLTADQRRAVPDVTRTHLSLVAGL